MGTAILFSVFFVIVYICIDIMSLAHNGLTRDGLSEGYHKCIFKEVIDEQTGAVSKKLNIMGIFFVIIPREGITVFMACLCFWMQRPEILALVGFVTVFLNLITSFLSSLLFPVDGHGDHHHDDHHNVIIEDFDDEKEEVDA